MTRMILNNNWFSLVDTQENSYINSENSAFLDNLVMMPISQMIGSIEENNEWGNTNQQTSKVAVGHPEYKMSSSLSNNERHMYGKDLYINNTSSETEKLLLKIRDSYFEPGNWTEADAYFEHLTSIYSDFNKPLSYLSYITNQNLKDEHILEGVLHILSYYPYDVLEPYGITIAIACTVNHSPVIQDLLITCFDNWESTDAIPVLYGIDFDKSWLKEYCEEVLTKLKQIEQSA